MTCVMPPWAALRRLAWPGGILTVALVAAALFKPLPFGLALKGWLIAIAALAANVLVRSVAGDFERMPTTPIRLRRALGPPAERPADLGQVERAVEFASWNSFDIQNRLRPLLHDIAAHRLALHRGIDLDRNPEAAQAVLGEDLWTLLLDRSGGTERFGPGIPVARLRAAVAGLEAIV